MLSSYLMADTKRARPTLSNHRILKVAVAAVADPKTVRKVLAGEPVRGDVGDRIADELKRLGMR